MPTITTVPGTDTVNQMRTAHNDNDAALKVETEAATAAIAAHKAAGNTDHDGRYSTIAMLTAHKTSTDHDGRYYTETEIDASVVKLTGDQTVAGVKTHTSDILVKKANPAVELQDEAGNRLAKLVGSSDSDNSLLLQVFDTSAGQYVSVLKVQKNGTISDAAGNPLATKKYAQSMARSGFFCIPIQRYVADGASSTAYPVQDSAGQTLVIPIPNGAILKQLRFQYAIGSEVETMVEAVSVAFTDSGHTWITAEFAVGNDDRYLTLKVYGWRNVASVPTSTLIASAQHATDSGFGGAWRASAVLEFSL